MLLYVKSWRNPPRYLKKRIQILDLSEAEPPNGSDSWKGGAISPGMYVEMRRIAECILERYPGAKRAHPSSLIHEAVYKLRRYGPSQWASPRHFLNVARLAMVQVLLDRIRAPGPGLLVNLENAGDVCEKDPLLDEMLTFDQAIVELQRLDPRMRAIVVSKAVERRTDAETALELGMSVRSVQRKWRFAKAFIGTKLSTEHGLRATSAADKARARTKRSAPRTKG